MLKTTLMLACALTLSFAESPVQIQGIRSEYSETLGANVGNSENRLNQAMLKALEGLVPSNMKFLAKSVLNNVDLKGILKSVVRFVIPTANDNKKISKQCREDSWLYAESLANFTEWALKMFDATGKVTHGILSGNYRMMGHFDQCLDVKGPGEGFSPKFSGKYCTAFLKPIPVPARQSQKNSSQPILGSLPFEAIARQIDPELLKMVNPRDLIKQLPSLAVCLPSRCSARDIETGLADITAIVGLPEFNGMQLVPFVREDFCTVAGTQRDYDSATIIVMFTFGILALCLVLGTVYDAYLRQKEKHTEGLKTTQRALLSFSILANGSSVLDPNDSTEGNLCCLHGIRALSSFWVVLYHTFGESVKNPNANTAQVKEDNTGLFYQVITNGSLSVDSFFFLSGLLVCYTKLRELDKSTGKLNVPFMYLNRYLRLTPLLSFFLAFTATSFVHVSTGPYWGDIVLQSKACQNSWWYYLSYSNNFFPDNSDCMQAAWFLAVDMQLFLISPVFIYALWRWPKFGITALGVAIVGFTATSMFIIFFENLPPTFLATANVDPKILLHFYNDYYQMPWCRIMPYLVGIFMGYVLHTTHNVTTAMKPWLVVTGWSTATSIILAVLFGMVTYTDVTKVPAIPQAVSVLYGSLHRTAWAVSLSWLVFACVRGYGGFVNRFLSGSVFIPLSRISYSTYLTQGMWLGYYYGHRRTVDYYTAHDLLALRYCNNLLVSLILAFIATVCVEAPFMNLQKMCFNAKSKDTGSMPILVRDIPGRSEPPFKEWLTYIRKMKCCVKCCGSKTRGNSANSTPREPQM